MIPQPVSVRPAEGAFALGAETPLDAPAELGGVASWLRTTLRCPLPPGGGGVSLRVDRALVPEAYELSCASGRLRITGGSAAGVFYGGQTLRQLLPPAALRRAGPTGWLVPAGTVTDRPRFGWRGVMLDVARHFMPVPDVLRFVDLAAFHKLNVLHLHLTDDQGWRLEVPGWPRLTDVGAWRAESMLGARQHARYDGRPHGGFYTADDLREIVAYAGERHVRVVPEVDMPGHMQAAVAAYPELGNGFAGGVRTGWGISSHVLNLGERSLEFCRAVLDQLCELFPSELIGIGGDECPRDEWAGEDRQPAFTALMAAHLAARGRRIYGWDEILEGGAPAGAVVAAWRGKSPTTVAARRGHQVVACPDIAAYLDYRQSDDPGEPTPVGTRLTLADVYAFSAVPEGLSPAERELVLGGQANVWTEHMETARQVDYMTYPRLSAFAEAVWDPPGRSYESFETRLPAHLERLDALGVNYRPPSGPRPWDARPDAPGNPRELPDRLAELAEMTKRLDPAEMTKGVDSPKPV
ncbi:beta-N-acetylhexosaminidase [Paractinoplanes hotanensis]|uniref:beta-N-acetylhexosaminidase n=1 Tax=Paractinoplanes hotanensis TaxID=2906497 RepID=A0ABT0XZ88_9ACTN|nr:beta-N-acetylhexosaminidase [Actinoplanes hotanensis]MCM4079091.1 beta-N-acetylhexosaminidase [Actinoplanes hotanensis]